jgi:putative ABC transport system substrate-binding protein
MDRRAFVRAAALNLLPASALLAQGPAKLARLGIVSTGANGRSAPFYVAFEQKLRELGWVDGKNLAIDFEVGESPEQLSELATRMVKRGIDVILAAGPEAVLKAATDATQTIPIVMVALNYDPVEKGFVANLARPGRNITGVSFRNPEVGPKQLELLSQAVPGATRVGVLWTAYSSDQIAPVEKEAMRLRLRIEKVALAPPYDIEKAFDSLKTLRVDAVLVQGDPILYREKTRIAAMALERRLPVCGGLSGVYAGYLLGFGPDLDGALKVGAQYVNKIMRGAKAGDMPIEQPDKFDLVVNLKTARALGITVPQALLLRANEVIQ